MATSPWWCPKRNKRRHCATSVFTQWAHFWGSWKKCLSVCVLVTSSQSRLLSFSAQCTWFQPIRWQSRGHMVKAGSGWIRFYIRSRPAQTPSETPISTAITPTSLNTDGRVRNTPVTFTHVWRFSHIHTNVFVRVGHSPADYRLLSVQVMIRHGDRYPLYSIPKTKRPAIDCTLSDKRYTRISICPTSQYNKTHNGLF